MGLIITPSNGLTAAEKLEMNQEFGQKLIKLFYLDNAREHGKRKGRITRNEAKSLKSKFSDAIIFADSGDLLNLYEEIEELQTDAIFTLERKNKYLLMIYEFLNPK
jgi:hypothetical protein